MIQNDYETKPYYKKVKVFAFRNRNLPFPMKKEYTVYLLQSIQRVTGKFLLFLSEILDFYNFIFACISRVNKGKFTANL